MLAIRCASLIFLLLLQACVRPPSTDLGSLRPRDYEATDLSAYSRCFAGSFDFDRVAGVPLLTVTFLGTTSLLLDDGKTQLIIDGFISRPPVHDLLRPVSSDLREIARVLTAVDANRVGAVFVAHAHYDHALDAAEVARWTRAPLHGSPSVLNLGHGARLPVDRLLPLVPFREVQVGDFAITALPAVHSPPDIYNRNLGQEIAAPMRQPLRAGEMVEGGSFDFLIRHGTSRIFVRPAAGFRSGALHGVEADVLFLAVGALGNQPVSYRDAFYSETVGRLRPNLIVPVHWDSPFRKLSEPLLGTPEAIDNVRDGLDSVIGHALTDGIPVMMLGAMQRIPLNGYFDGAAPAAPRGVPSGQCEPSRQAPAAQAEAPLTPATAFRTR